MASRLAPWGDGDDDAGRGGRLEVDRVRADPDARDDPELPARRPGRLAPKGSVLTIAPDAARRQLGDLGRVAAAVLRCQPDAEAAVRERAPRVLPVRVISGHVTSTSGIAVI